VGDSRRHSELREPGLQTLQLGCVLVELGGTGPAPAQDLPHQHEAADVEEKIV
jgi:hypothetical protein